MALKSSDNFSDSTLILLTLSYSRIEIDICNLPFTRIYLIVGQGSLRPFAKISGDAVTLQLSAL